MTKERQLFYTDGLDVFKRPHENAMGFLVCTTSEYVEGAAEEIATALSCHDELLEALEAMLEGRATNPPPDSPFVPKDGVAWRNWRLFEKAREVIAKARGE